MGRWLALDIGSKRTGIAVTDPLRIIATALDTVPTKELVPFLKNYFLTEQVDIVVVGEPKQMDNSPSESAGMINKEIEKEKKILNIPTRLKKSSKLESSKEKITLKSDKIINFEARMAAAIAPAAVSALIL